jgi:hypothetical protein
MASQKTFHLLSFSGKKLSNEPEVQRNDMNKQKWIISILALGLMGGAAALLAHFQMHQKLGVPGVKTSPQAGTGRLRVELPARALDYDSELLEPDSIVLGTLPQDTSFGQRRYKASDGFETVVNVVLMGTDRTSLHKPQFCLEGAGWHIDDNASSPAVVHLERPYPYDLSVVKLISTKEVIFNNEKVTARGVYVYWFVADNALSAGASGFQRMWWMARERLRTGVLQRWAYVSYFAPCAPGQEEATFERMKKLIAATVPEFQLTPRAADAALAARQ